VITTPHGWSAQRLEDGLRLTRDAAVLEYVERLRPLRSAVELARTYAAGAALEVTRVHAPKRLVTDEGEHAALVLVDAGAVQLVFGFVFLDDHYARIVGTGVEPAVVEEIVRKDCHVLGKGRRRRFVYDRPAGWQAKDGLIETSWYPLDYPKQPATLTVSLALPAMPGLETALLRQAVGDRTDRGGFLGPATPIRTARLTGALHHVIAGTQPDDAETFLVLLTDGVYVYGIRLDTRRSARGAGLAALDAVVASVEPVPHARTQIVNRSSAVSHWAE